MSGSDHDSPRLSRKIAGAISRARAFSLIEAVWPRTVVAASIVGVFLSLSWLGLWPLLPDLARFAVVGLLAIAFVAACFWVIRAPILQRDALIKRVEQASGLKGRPLASLEDTPFDLRSENGKALWQAHQDRVAHSVQTLAAGSPRPQTHLMDRWALRAPVMLILVVSFFVAGPQRLDRIEQAFAPPAAAPITPIRVDVWATPPSYSGLPPRTLLTAETMEGSTEPQPDIRLPTGSRLTVLISDPTAVEVGLITLDTDTALPLETAQNESTALETVLDTSATLSLNAPQGSLSLALLIEPDAPPTITFAEEPGASLLGALELTYTAEDDFGVEAATAQVVPANPDYADATPLIEAPTIDLVLPQERSGGTVEATRDLSAHPWAGLEVEMTLQARDGAGQLGTSEPETLELPVRPFREDLARALVEQRRLLAVDPRTQPWIVTALEGLAIAPEDFMDGDYTNFLALTVTTQRLRLAETDDQKREVIDLLWQLALQVEDGDLSLAAERLREAEENLAEALENGASEEEIQQLMDELRQAFQEYMQALAERMQNSENAQIPPDAQLQNLNPQAMQDLMDQIQDLAEMGASDAARELLNQLRQQLEQMRGAQAMQQREPSPQEQQLRESIEELQAITREQQRLLDETFPFSWDSQRQEIRPQPSPDTPGQQNQQQQRGQNNTPDGENGEQQEEPPFGDLAEQQRNLREQLQSLMDQLAELGLDPSDFGEAGDAMEGAANMLERNSANNALTQQGRALEALRQGAQSMMEQLAEGQGQQGEGQGQAQGPGQSPGPGQGLPRIMMGPGADGARGTDPLGRPQRDSGQQQGGTVRIPEESDIQRARDILDEIQRRLSDQLRPQGERDYLDRLIERF